jgi:hypothetical protein
MQVQSVPVYTANGQVSQSSSEHQKQPTSCIRTGNQTNTKELYQGIHPLIPSACQHRDFLYQLAQKDY